MVPGKDRVINTKTEQRYNKAPPLPNDSPNNKQRPRNPEGPRGGRTTTGCALRASVLAMHDCNINANRNDTN